MISNIPYRPWLRIMATSFPVHLSCDCKVCLQVRCGTRGISADLDVGGLQVFSKDTQPVLHTMVFCSLPVKHEYNVQSGQ